MKLKEYCPTKMGRRGKNQRKIQYLDPSHPRGLTTVTIMSRLIRMEPGATIFRDLKIVFWKKTIGFGKAWMKMAASEKENMLHKKNAPINCIFIIKFLIWIIKLKKNREN